MPLVRNCLVTGVALLCLAAQAQVLRCTDARTGQVTYTDGACTGAATVREVEPRKTAQEIQLERDQAAEALARKQQQRQAEAAARQIDADRDAQREREQAERTTRPATRPQDYARSAECARSRRNLDVVVSSASGSYDQNLRVETAQRQVDLDCLGPEAYAELEKPARPGWRHPLRWCWFRRAIRSTPGPHHRRHRAESRSATCSAVTTARATATRAERHPGAGQARSPSATVG